MARFIERSEDLYRQAKYAMYVVIRTKKQRIYRSENGFALNVVQSMIEM